MSYRHLSLVSRLSVARADNLLTKDRQRKNNIGSLRAYVGAMQCSLRRSMRLFGSGLKAGAMVASLALACHAVAQDTPVISGGVGFLTNTNQYCIEQWTYTPPDKPVEPFQWVALQEPGLARSTIG